MSTTDPDPGDRVPDVRVPRDLPTVELLGGRTISAPIAGYPRLIEATATQRANCFRLTVPPPVDSPNARRPGG